MKFLLLSIIILFFTVYSHGQSAADYVELTRFSKLPESETQEWTFLGNKKLIYTKAHASYWFFCESEFIIRLHRNIALTTLKQSKDKRLAIGILELNINGNRWYRNLLVLESSEIADGPIARQFKLTPTCMLYSEQIEYIQKRPYGFYAISDFDNFDNVDFKTAIGAAYVPPHDIMWKQERWNLNTQRPVTLK